MNRPSPRDDMFFSSACNRTPHPTVAVVTGRFAPVGVGPVAVVLLVGWLLASGCQRGSPGDQATPAATAAAPATAEDRAMEILKKTVAAYQQAGTYADAGKVRSRAVVDGIVQEMDPIPFSVAMTRPNRIRAQMFETVVVSDGELLHAAAQSLPGQVLEVPTPAKLTDANFPPDPLLAQKMIGETPIFASPQLHLLLADDPLRAFTGGVAKAALISEAEAEGHRCHRVQVGDDKNRFVYWIDQETFVVRRVDLPSAPFTENADTNVVPKNVEVWFDLAGAKLGGPIEPAAFQFEVPADSQRLKAFVALPPPRPARIGEPIADFHFTDLEGNQVSRDSLRGKIVLLDFWFTTCPPCKVSLPRLSELYQRFKENDRVTFLAVSIDDPKLPDKQLVDTLKSWGVDLPILRDLDNQHATTLEIVGAPVTLLIGSDGTIQTYLVGPPPNYDSVGNAIDRLLAGEDVAAKVLEEYEQKVREYKRRLAEATVVASNKVIEVPNTKIAPASKPTTIGLEKLWQCEAVKQPGNILIVAADGKTPRIFVLDGWNAVAQVDTTGQVAHRYELDLPEKAAARIVRTAVDADGQRLFVVSGVGQQQLHLFNDRWERQWSFPEGEHAGIADVRFLDVSGEDRTEIVVGYWGDVGVQGIGLDGQRLWSNRTLQNVMQMAVTDADPQTGRSVLCVNRRGTLVPIDASGRETPDIRVARRAIIHVTSADVDGDGQVEFCALAAVGVGQRVAVGIDAQGDELWNYQLPEGVHKHQIEPITSAALDEGDGGWLLAGPDGSIHLLTKEGQLVDHFNYGVALSGIGIAPIEGVPVLLVASENGLAAFKISVDP